MEGELRDLYGKKVSLIYKETQKMYLCTDGGRGQPVEISYHGETGNLEKDTENYIILTNSELVVKTNSAKIPLKETARKAISKSLVGSIGEFDE
ncbi:MAG: hypothetical protein AABW50_05305 [Nanoarchaeota archaeon]